MILNLGNGFYFNINLFICVDVYAAGVYREARRQHLGVDSPLLLVSLGG